MRFRDKYPQKSSGFSEVGIYLYDRYFVLSDQYRGTRRYVSLHRDNRDTFSDEFASIMFSACSVFESAMRDLLKVAGRTPKGRPEMKDYSAFLLDEVPELDRYSVRVRAYLRQGLLLPFQGMTKRTPPKWWSAYNDLKHSHQPNYRVGNLENCLNSLAAVVVLAFPAGQEITDPLFSGVGSKFDPANPGVEELLFP